jgi:2-polyprenyl-3-methyl-5-hydroxy-6-metoxy-1,4-benzoquinol methylase
MTQQGLRGAHSLFDFGKLASDYERWYETPVGKAHDQAQESDVRRFLEPARPGARLLDVGCGTGHWSRFFASMGYEVHGVDISPEMIAVARSAGVSGCTFEVADVCALPFWGASFDVVAAMATLEFVSDVSLALEEMFRCVKRNGVVLIGTLNRLASINRRRIAEGREPYASGRLLSPGELRKLLKPYGRVRIIGSSPKGTQQARFLARWIAARKGRYAPFLVAEVRP